MTIDPKDRIKQKIIQLIEDQFSVILPDEISQTLEPTVDFVDQALRIQRETDDL